MRPTVQATSFLASFAARVANSTLIPNSTCNRYLCNRAAAYLGAGYHSEALKDCDLALSLDPSLDKALLRRALAREALCKHQEALVDVQQLLGRTQFGSALHTRALDLKRRLDRLVWQEDHTLQTNQAAHLFTSEQTLRLNFRTPPPGAVALGDYFEVSVFVANEFGLFGSKQFEAQHEPVQLQVCEERGARLANQEAIWCLERDEKGYSIGSWWGHASRPPKEHFFSSLSKQKACTGAHAR